MSSLSEIFLDCSSAKSQNAKHHDNVAGPVYVCVILSEHLFPFKLKVNIIIEHVVGQDPLLFHHNGEICNSAF